MSEHKNNKLFGVVSHWIVYLTFITLLIPALLAVYWMAEKAVTYGGLPDRIENIRGEMTNLVSQLKTDNDQQHVLLRQEMRQGFHDLKSQIEQLPAIQARPYLSPYGSITTNGVILFPDKNDAILLSATVHTNQLEN